MANAWVSQFRTAAIINGVSIDVPLGPPLRTEKVAFTDTAGVSAAIGSDCGLVVIYTDSDAHWLAGAAPTATEADTPLTAGFTIYLVPTGLHKFSFVGEPVSADQFTPDLFLLLMGS